MTFILKIDDRYVDEISVYGSFRLSKKQKNAVRFDSRLMAYDAAEFIGDGCRAVRLREAKKT